MKKFGYIGAVLIAFLISVPSTFGQAESYKFKDSSGNSYEYYGADHLVMEEKAMTGMYAGGPFTVIKIVDRNGWLIQTALSEMPAKTFYLKIPKNWDIQTFQNGMEKHTGKPPFRAFNCLNLIVYVTNKFKTFTHTLDDTEDSIRVLELKAIAAQPCSE
jgi:hypothetical protein